MFIVGANYDSNYDSTTVIMIDDQQSFHFTRLFKICDQFGDSFAHSFDQQCISPMKARVAPGIQRKAPSMNRHSDQ